MVLDQLESDFVRGDIYANDDSKFLVFLMANTRPKPQDLAERLEHLSSLLASLEEELVQLYSQGEVAPTGSWITRYQARGQSKCYWYYKWQASYPVFPTADGQLSRYKHLGKAGSAAYLEALTQILRRAQTEGLEQAIKTLKAGLQDLCEEGMKNRTEGRIRSRN